MNRKLLYFAKYRWFLPVFFSSALLFLIICAMLYRVRYMRIVIYSRETIKMDLKNNNLKPRAPNSSTFSSIVGRSWCMWDLQIFCTIMYSYQMYINKTYNRIFREEYDDRFRVISIAFHEHSSWIFSLFIFSFIPPRMFKWLDRLCRDFCIVKSTSNHLLILQCKYIIVQFLFLLTSWLNTMLQNRPLKEGTSLGIKSQIKCEDLGEYFPKNETSHYLLSFFLFKTLYLWWNTKGECLLSSFPHMTWRKVLAAWAQ